MPLAQNNFFWSSPGKGLCLDHKGCGKSSRQKQNPPKHKGFYLQGLGTKEGVIIEILASRTKRELQEIMKAYEEGKWSAKRVLESLIKAHLRIAINFGSLTWDEIQTAYWVPLAKILSGLFHTWIQTMSGCAWHWHSTLFRFSLYATRAIIVRVEEYTPTKFSALLGFGNVMSHGMSQK